MTALNKLRPFGVPGTFLDNTQNPSLEEANAAIFGIAFDATASYNKGAWFGPQAIMAASHQIEYETPVFGISLSDKVKIHSFGELKYPRQLRKGQWVEWENQKIEELLEEMVSDAEEIASLIFQKKRLLVGLGGEHSTSNGIFRALAKEFEPKEITLVHLDAHLDMRESWEGQKYNHASIIHRALDFGFQSVHIGIRDHVTEEEAEFLKKKHLVSRVFPCPTMPLAYYVEYAGVFEKQNFLWKGIFSEAVCRKIFSQIKTKFAYFSIDVDAFDPAFFPGTGTPLPFGLDFSSTQDFLYELFLHMKQKGIRLLGFDVQEVSPQLRKNVAKYDALETVSTQTEMNAALLVYKILLWNYLDRFSPQH